MVTLDDRIEFRLPKAVKTRIEAAATLSGQTVSAFVTASAVAKADELLSRQTLTELTEQDARRFLEILEADAEPNARMRAAAARLKDLDRG
ncbi:MAG: DUF1778 domain-containing protein [Deltaproteobacteria bacterium]|nr:DUF1778 domain-containing protein [Deltaproteobacteria bacterium]